MHGFGLRPPYNPTEDLQIYMHNAIRCNGKEKKKTQKALQALQWVLGDNQNSSSPN